MDVLISSENAAHFLRTYRALLSTFAGRALMTSGEYEEVRSLLLTGPARKNPPTADADLLQALETAVYGEFTVARHLPAYTEMVGADGRAFLVRGVTTELKDLVPAWSLVRTAVMSFREDWICDGLIVDRGIRIGPGLRKGILEQVRRGSVPRRASPNERQGQKPVASRWGFTEKQGQYLAFIQQYTKLNRQAPAEADMQRYFQVSPPSVHQMIMTLEKRGLIRRVPGQSRSVAVLVPEEALPRLV